MFKRFSILFIAVLTMCLSVNCSRYITVNTDKNISTERVTENRNIEKSKIETEIDEQKKINLEIFNLLETGMTYEDVVEIIGFEPQLQSAIGEKGTPYYTETYLIHGSQYVDGSLGANVILQFQDGALFTKAQMGLK